MRISSGEFIRSRRGRQTPECEYARRFAQNRTGASGDSLARQYIFRPLGMRDISFQYADRNENVHWHTGPDWGEKAMVFYFPQRREGVVLLTNGANGFMPMIQAGLLLFPDRESAHFLRSGGS